jgi:hypothetical protein
LAFTTLSSYINDKNGKNGNLDVAGEFVFGALVIVANMKILCSSFLISIFQISVVILSVLSYILCYYILSTSMKSAEYGSIQILMTEPGTYFDLMLFTFMFVLVDVGMQHLTAYINVWYTA